MSALWQLFEKGSVLEFALNTGLNQSLKVNMSSSREAEIIPGTCNTGSFQVLMEGMFMLRLHVAAARVVLLDQQAESSGALYAHLFRHSQVCSF